MIGLPIGQPGEADESFGSRRGGRFLVGEEALQPLPAFGQLTGNLPEAPDGARQMESEIRVGSVEGVLKGGAEVVQLL